MYRKIRLLLFLLLAAFALSPALAFEMPEGTLHRGIEGHTEEIEFLQYQLFYAGYLGEDVGEVDGIFGKKTESAVKAFQRDYGLEQTGIVCPDTQIALDEVWESGMEPQGGADMPAFCQAGHNANGTPSLVLCEHHMNLFARAHGALLAALSDDAQTVAALKTHIQMWRTELDALYQRYIDASPPALKAPLLDHQSAFLGYYDAQLALWQAQYGIDSIAALEKACTALSDQCVCLCALLAAL